MAHLVHLSYIGRVVGGAVAVVGGTLAIGFLAAPIIGLTYAALGIVALIGGAIILGVLIRPEPDPTSRLPPAQIPERPSDFGFLKWWEFRRALNRAREVTLAEVEAETLDAMAEGSRQSLSAAEVVRKLEAREREVRERFGFRAKE